MSYKVLAAALVLAASSAVAEPAQAPILRYGASLTLAEAKVLLNAAEAEARRSSPASAIAIIGSGGELILFEKLDDTQLASIEIARRKASTALDFKRPTKVQNDLLTTGAAGATQLALPGLETPLAGGIPLVRDGRIVGAIGVSGGTGDQDQRVALVGAQAVR